MLNKITLRINWINSNNRLFSLLIIFSYSLPAVGEVEQLLNHCEQHFQANRLTTGVGGTAFSCYQEVLKQDPDNLPALAGLKKIEARYLKWIKSALARGQMDKVRQYSIGLQKVNPQSMALIRLEKSLSLPNRVIKTFTGHKKTVWSVAFSPDGTLLASASEDKTFKLWDLKSKKLHYTNRTHDNIVFTVTFHPVQPILASGSHRLVQLWNSNTGNVLTTLPNEPRGTVYSLAFSPDGQLLAAGSGDNSIKLWQIDTGKLLHTLYGHEWAIRSVSFNPDGDILVSGSSDNTIKLWDVNTGKVINTLLGHQDWVQAVTFSPTGQLLASGSRDNTIKLWNYHTGKIIHTLLGHEHDVNSVAFNPNGTILASASEDKTIKLWNVTTGNLINTLTGHSKAIKSVTFSPNGATLASGSRDQTVKLWQ